MFIQTEQTPNPETLKFIPGQPVLTNGTAEFKEEGEAGSSPLAKRLFAVDGVKSVFFATDFLSVTKEEDQDWALLTSHIMNALMEHLTSGFPIMDEDQGSSVESDDDEDDDEVVTQIKAILNERVRPAVAQDGGDIAFDRFEEGVVYLRMRGACSGCPSSTMTLKAGVENLLKHFVPEVLSVEAVPD